MIDCYFITACINYVITMIMLLFEYEIELKWINEWFHSVGFGTGATLIYQLNSVLLASM